MGKKKNRCRLKSCNVVIKPEYTHCYAHRRCRSQLLDTPTEVSSLPVVLSKYKRFYCEECGTVLHSMSYQDCQYCGRATEEVN